MNETIKNENNTLPRYGTLLEHEISYLEQLHSYWIGVNPDIAHRIAIRLDHLFRLSEVQQECLTNRTVFKQAR